MCKRLYYKHIKNIKHVQKALLHTNQTRAEGFTTHRNRKCAEGFTTNKSNMYRGLYLTQIENAQMTLLDVNFIQVENEQPAYLQNFVWLHTMLGVAFNYLWVLKTVDTYPGKLWLTELAFAQDLRFPVLKVRHHFLWNVQRRGRIRIVSDTSTSRL